MRILSSNYPGFFATVSLRENGWAVSKILFLGVLGSPILCYHAANWRGKRLMDISTRRRVSLNAAPMRGVWRRCVALFTALSFFLVVATSASHLHETTAAAHACAICCVVVEKLAGAPPPPLLVHAVALQSYRIVAAAPVEVAYCSPRLRPPSCGPPHAFA
jgi:hypothetical protein